MEISNDVLVELVSLEIDNIRTFAEDCSRTSHTLYLYKEKFMGVYILGKGLILEPIYFETMRISEDIIKVGVRNENLVYYGGFSINTRSFVIPPIYTPQQFRDEYKKYCSVFQNRLG